VGERSGERADSKRSCRITADSVANVSQIVTLDRTVFSEHAGRLPEPLLQLVLAGIEVVLGR
jgi:mRNA-degrading endonuclease toxin of MazEF toxin-antitoxin module